jgi:hypothetical protein
LIEPFRHPAHFIGMRQLLPNLRKTIPVVLVAAGLWMLAGCFKIPIWPTRSIKEQYDFRNELGGAGSSKPVRPGAITRMQVIERFGPPEHGSSKSSLTYELELNRAVYVWPLCFHVDPADQRLYVLDLSFDDKEVLSGWKLYHWDRGVAPIMHDEHFYGGHRTVAIPDGEASNPTTQKTPDKE